MNFGFTEEQELLRDQVRKFLDEKCASEDVRRIMKSDLGYDEDLWCEMAELGWLGLMIPEEFGGVGLGWVDLTVVLEEMGRSLYPSPYISQLMAASAIVEAGSEEQKKRWLPSLCTGQKIATLALQDTFDSPIAASISLTASSVDNGILLKGEKHFVPDLGAADLVFVACLVSGELMLAAIPADAEGVTRKTSATMDETKRIGTLGLENVFVARDNLISISDENLSRIFDKGCIAVTAEAIGAAESVLTMTTDYARERIQFDNPIGKYQGVKHRLAEIYVDVESFKSLLYYAAWTADESPAELPRSASLAKAYASDAFASIGIEGVQLHGAIGFTQEYDIQLFLKRSKWVRPAYGDADFHYERVASLGGL